MRLCVDGAYSVVKCITNNNADISICNATGSQNKYIHMLTEFTILKHSRLRQLLNGPMLSPLVFCLICNSNMMVFRSSIGNASHCVSYNISTNPLSYRYPLNLSILKKKRRESISNFIYNLYFFSVMLNQKYDQKNTTVHLNIFAKLTNEVKLHCIHECYAVTSSISHLNELC